MPLTPANVTIRPIQVTQLPQVEAIEHLLEGEHAATLETLQRRQRTFPNGFLCALKGPKIVGYAENFVWETPEADTFNTFNDITPIESEHTPGGNALYTTMLVTHPAHRQEGIGRALMEVAQTLAETEGTQRMELAASQASPFIVPFYESLGYEAVRELPEFTPGLDCVFMQKTL